MGGCLESVLSIGPMKREIIGFHRDAVGDWVADLTCGHTQHVRHNPPLVSRPWVLREDGRRQFIGHTVECLECERDGDGGNS